MVRQWGCTSSTIEDPGAVVIVRMRFNVEPICHILSELLQHQVIQVLEVASLGIKDKLFLLDPHIVDDVLFEMRQLFQHSGMVHLFSPTGQRKKVFWFYVSQEEKKVMSWYRWLLLVVLAYLSLSAYFVIFRNGVDPSLYIDVKFLFYSSVILSSFVLVYQVIQSEQKQQLQIREKLLEKETVATKNWLKSIQDTPELFPATFLAADDQDIETASLANQFFLSVDDVVTQLHESKMNLSPSTWYMWHLYMTPPLMKELWRKARMWYPQRTRDVLDPML